MKREVHDVDLRWLLALRWGAILGQTLAVGAARLWLDLDVPVVPVLSLLALQIVGNALVMFWARRRRAVSAWVSAAALGTDFLFLTILLALTGGAANPFSILYIVGIALACVLLPRPFAWAVAVLALACFGLLFTPTHPSHVHDMALHFRGMWFAFAIAAALVVYFVTRLSSLLAEREQALAAARAQAARHEKLSALATLAAGAAHELSTPLSTIALVASELARRLSTSADAEVADDARLIRAEVARCRAILAQLAQLAQDVGGTVGEPRTDVRWRELTDLATRELRTDRVGVTVAPEIGAASVRVPARSLAQALRALIKNALEATPSGRVQISVSRAAREWLLEVRDQGAGIAPDVLSRIGEPFFTTKEIGKGMGLGIFVARGVVERLGGTIELRSSAGAGTHAIVRLPEASLV